MVKNIVVIINTTRKCYKLLHRTELKAISESINQLLLKDGDALIVYTIADTDVFATSEVLNREGNQFLK